MKKTMRLAIDGVAAVGWVSFICIAVALALGECGCGGGPKPAVSSDGACVRLSEGLYVVDIHVDDGTCSAGSQRDGTFRVLIGPGASDMCSARVIYRSDCSIDMDIKCPNGSALVGKAIVESSYEATFEGDLRAGGCSWPVTLHYHM